MIDMRLEYDYFPMKSYDKIRFADTDCQGHVNSAVFSTFLETGRTELLIDSGIWKDEMPIFGLVGYSINLMSEINWPGTVEIGTAVKRMGNSSITFLHGLYQNGNLVATAETILVQMDDVTRKSKPFSDQAREAFNKYMVN
jgi:acyl-CoA thioester hydrolase